MNRIEPLLGPRALTAAGAMLTLAVTTAPAIAAGSSMPWESRCSRSWNASRGRSPRSSP